MMLHGLLPHREGDLACYKSDAQDVDVAVFALKPSPFENAANAIAIQNGNSRRASIEK